MSGAFEVRSTEDKGKAIVAAENLNPGTFVLEFLGEPCAERNMHSLQVVGSSSPSSSLFVSECRSMSCMQVSLGGRLGWVYLGRVC